MDDVRAEADEADAELEEAEAEVSDGIEIVEELDKTMYTQKSCNMRNGDSTDYEKVGAYEWGEAVHVTGKTANGWYRIAYVSAEGTEETGYIAGSLLGDSIPQAPQPQAPAQSGGGSSSSGGGSLTQKYGNPFDAVGGGTGAGKVVEGLFY